VRFPKEGRNVFALFLFALPPLAIMHRLSSFLLDFVEAIASDFIVRKMIGLAISLPLTAFFAVVIYLFLRRKIRDEDQVIRFLDRRYDVIRRNGFWGNGSDYIDAKMIRKWGRNGWGLVIPSSLGLSLFFGQLWSVGGISSIILLFFAGTFFAESRLAAHFLTVLGVNQYRPSLPRR